MAHISNAGENGNNPFTSSFMPTILGQQYFPLPVLMRIGLVLVKAGPALQQKATKPAELLLKPGGFVSSANIFPILTCTMICKLLMELQSLHRVQAFGALAVHDSHNAAVLGRFNVCLANIRLDV